MGMGADYIGAQGYGMAPVFSCPKFRLPHQSSPNASPAMIFVYHQTSDLEGRVRQERVNNKNVNPANQDTIRFGNIHGVLTVSVHVEQSSGCFFRSRAIAQLS